MSTLRLPGDLSWRRVETNSAFSDFYRTEFPAVYRTTYLLCGDPELASDATQEAFARCFARWGRLRDRSWVGGWVTTTALNVARRGLRRHRGSQALAGGAPLSEPDLAILDLWRVIRELPRRQQEALVLHYLAEIPVTDVAEIMNCSPGSVKTHLSRARDALRTQLEEVLDA